MYMPQRSPLCGDAERAMQADARTSAHDNAIHECDVWDGQAGQQQVQAVLNGEKGVRSARIARSGSEHNCLDVATRTESLCELKHVE
jgi:hypothetical protein